MNKDHVSAAITLSKCLERGLFWGEADYYTACDWFAEEFAGNPEFDRVEWDKQTFLGD